MSILYNRIEQLCNQQNLTIGKLCSNVAISRGNLSDLKSGRTKSLSSDKLKKIADYFSVSIDYLLGQNKNDTMLELSDTEQTLINTYRKLDTKKKTIALAEIYKLSE